MSKQTVIIYSPRPGGPFKFLETKEGREWKDLVSKLEGKLGLQRKYEQELATLQGSIESAVPPDKTLDALASIDPDEEFKAYQTTKEREARVPFLENACGKALSHATLIIRELDKLAGDGPDAISNKIRAEIHKEQERLRKQFVKWNEAQPWFTDKIDKAFEATRQYALAQSLMFRLNHLFRLDDGTPPASALAKIKVIFKLIDRYEKAEGAFVNEETLAAYESRTQHSAATTAEMENAAS